MSTRPPPKARPDDDLPALHSSLIAMGIRQTVARCKRLVTLDNGETRWVVFASDALAEANREVAPFVKAGRLLEKEQVDTVEVLKHNVF